MTVCRHRMYGPAHVNLVSLAAGSPSRVSCRSISARSATHRHVIARPGGSAEAELGGESSAQPQEFLPLGPGRPDARCEIEDGSAGVAGAVAVPGAVLVELEAWCPVFVQSVGRGVAYATEVKRRLKPRIALLRTGYP